MKKSIALLIFFLGLLIGSLINPPRTSTASGIEIVENSNYCFAILNGTSIAYLGKGSFQGECTYGRAK